MRKTSIFLMLVLSSSVANAGGLLDTIRQAKEIVDVAKEVNQASKDVQQLNNQQAVPANNQNPQTAQQAQQPVQQVQPTQPVAGQLQTGDVLTTKIKAVSVFQDANKKSKKLAQLPKAAELVFTGEEQNGFYRVQSDKGDGWVEKLLVKKL